MSVLMLVKKASICNELAEEKDRNEEKGLRVPLVHLRAEETDLFHSTTLLRMLVSHSKYPSLLEESQAKSDSMPCHIIQMLHCLIVSHQVTKEKSSTCPELAKAEVKVVVDSLRSLYTGQFAIAIG